MGDIADMMLDGTLCEGCGVYLGEAVDYPRRCKPCQKDQRVDALRTATHTHHQEQKTPCPTCGKRVKIVGLTDHMRDSHGVTPNVEVRGAEQASPAERPSSPPCMGEPLIARPKVGDQLNFPETEIKLAPDEHYAGLILGKDGEESYHLILLPGKGKNITWANAKSWANDVGGELPTRREQALLYANLQEQFEAEWYWSSEQHAGNDACAWCQYFSYGNQGYGHKGGQCRARAVRRLAICAGIIGTSGLID